MIRGALKHGLILRLRTGWALRADVRAVKAKDLGTRHA
jgi:hypothetical protein